jgi:hypothetical protein
MGVAPLRILIDSLAPTTVPLLAVKLHYEQVVLGGAQLLLPTLDVSLEQEERIVRWWWAGAVMGAATLLLFVLQQLVAFLVMGCGAGPALWRSTRVLSRVEKAELRAFVGTQCATQESMYHFGMSLEDAWRVESATPTDAFEERAEEWRERGKMSDRRRLFHGTGVENAHAIVGEGFRLPPHAGMFGASSEIRTHNLLFPRAQLAGGDEFTSRCRQGRVFRRLPAEITEVCGMGLGTQVHARVRRRARSHSRAQDGALEPRPGA